MSMRAKWRAFRFGEGMARGKCEGESVHPAADWPMAAASLGGGRHRVIQGNYLAFPPGVPRIQPIEGMIEAGDGGALPTLAGGSASTVQGSLPDPAPRALNAWDSSGEYAPAGYAISKVAAWER